MKRSIKLAVAAAVALSASSAFATNGDHLIGLGAKARGMGGVGIGMSHGAETALSNPALITTVKGTEVQFGGTVFMPDVAYEGSMGGTSLGAKQSSAADLSVIPEVSLASKVSDNFWFGIGMWGTAGMGVDYRSANDGTMGSAMTNSYGTWGMATNLQLMQFAVPLAYKDSGISLAIAPVLQYGSLDMDFQGTAYAPNSGMTDIEAVSVNHGEGVSQDFGFGYVLGAAYEVDGLTIGASYKSAIEMEYKDQLSKAGQWFGFDFSDKLEQPAEIGIGVSYVLGENTLAVDYKRIKWSSAEGYEDFGWEDQNVIALGYQYQASGWAVRVGYNHASSPIKEKAVSATTPATMGEFQASMANGAINMLNLLGFPATVEDHYTIGGSYDISKSTSVDVAYTYAPEVTDTFAIAGLNRAAQSLSNPFGYVAGTSKATHSQQAVSFQLNYNF